MRSLFSSSRGYQCLSYYFAKNQKTQINYLINGIHHIVQHEELIDNQPMPLHSKKWFILLNPCSGARNTLDNFKDITKPIIDKAHITIDTYSI